jgi:hypothetical protein
MTISIEIISPAFESRGWTGNRIELSGFKHWFRTNTTFYLIIGMDRE